LVMDGTLHHDGNPVMTWCVSNTVVHRYKNEVITPDKASADKKIDGLVAALMALRPTTLLIPKKTSSFLPFFL